MLYECYRCNKLIDEKEGAMVYRGAFSPFIFKDIISLVFVCKDCLSKKGRETFEKARKK